MFIEFINFLGWFFYWLAMGVAVYGVIKILKEHHDHVNRKS